jgi:hypothetical protein
MPEPMWKPMITGTEKAVISRIPGRNRKFSFKYLQSVHFHPMKRMSFPTRGFIVRYYTLLVCFILYLTTSFRPHM